MLFWKRVQQAINKKWYPRSVTVGKEVDTQELAKRLARESTLSPSDVHAVIRALPEVLGDYMAESRAVHLEGLGWFRYVIKANGKGVDTKEEVSNAQIGNVAIQFTPERTRQSDGTYSRAIIDTSSISFAEWMGKDEDTTELPDAGEEEEGEGGSPDPM